MDNNIRSFLIFMFFLTPSTVAWSQSAVVDVTLVPAGSFKAETKKVKGKAYKSATGVTAENITVDLTTLTTGISLRDKHLKDRLMVNTYPEAVLTKASGRSGKGKGIIEIKGKKQQVAGTYKIVGNKLEAEFKMNLPKLDIKDVKYMGVGVSEDVTVRVTVPIVEK